jgi:pectate lyase
MRRVRVGLLLMSLGSSACSLTGSDLEPSIADQGAQASSCGIESCSSPGEGPLGQGAGDPDRLREGVGDDASVPQSSDELPQADLPLAGGDAPDSVPPGSSLEVGSDAGAPGSEVSQPGTQGSADAGALPAVVATPVGWASVAGLGLSTTTGGSGGETVRVTTAAELVELAARAEPLTIEIEGRLEVPDLSVASDKTLVGIGGEATLVGGIRIRGTEEVLVQNVILRDLRVEASSSAVDGDGVQIHLAHHVWIDHCAVLDASNELIGVVHGSDYVTLSWNRFFYTPAAPDPAHQFAQLLGNSVLNGAQDAEHLNVTLHHNQWGDGVSQAVLGRFGDIHAFNNHFRSPGNTSVLVAGLTSRWRVEANHFEQVAAPHALLQNSFAQMLPLDNKYVAITGAQDSLGEAFVPPYDYELDPVEDVAALVLSGAGPR